MEKNILIVDADDRQRSKITRIAREAVDESNVKAKFYQAVNATRAERILEQNDIDLLIFTMACQRAEKESLSGICLVEKLRKIEKYMFLPVIFVSSQKEMRQYAFTELNCLGYLSYEFDKERLGKIIKKGLHHTTSRERDKELYLKTDSILHPIRIKDIVYIESQKRGIQFNLRDGTSLHFPYRSLRDVNEIIGNRCLLQCGRNIIVNREYIDKANEKEVCLVNGEETISLQVGVTYRNVMKVVSL